MAFVCYRANTAVGTDGRPELARSAQARPTVLLLGDSIRLGYQASVTRLLAEIADVRGPEDNGSDTAYTLAHLDQWLGAESPAIVHCNCGLQDLKHENGAAGTVVPPAQYAENLATLFTRLRAHTPTLIFATTTPIDDACHAARGTPFARFDADVIAYNEIARAICTRHAIPVNDLNATVVATGSRAIMAPDGTHYTDAGYELLGRAVADAVRPFLR